MNSADAHAYIEVQGDDHKTAYHIVASNGVYGVRSINPKIGGKWYYEYDLFDVSTGDYASFGWATSNHSLTNTFVGNWSVAVGVGWGWSVGQSTFSRYYHDGTFDAGDTADSLACAAGSYGMCAIDLDTGKVWFGHNGTWHDGDPSTGEGYQLLETEVIGVEMFIMITTYANGKTTKLKTKSSEFEGTVPDGFSGPDDDLQIQYGLDPLRTISDITLSESNTRGVGDGSVGSGSGGSSLSLGKWNDKRYFEVYCTARTFSSILCSLGVALDGFDPDSYSLGEDPGGLSAAWAANAYFRYGGGNVTSLYSWAISVTYQLAINPTDGKIYFGRDGTWRGGCNPATDTSAFVFSSLIGAAYRIGGGFATTDDLKFRFKDTEFGYTRPTGYSALFPTTTTSTTTTTTV